MSDLNHGNPCWYELTTSKGNLASAEKFYGAVLGWTFADSGMPGMQYHLATSDDDMVAGLMAMPDEAMPPSWLIYFAVEDADQFVVNAKAAGANVHQEPGDVPGTGRFAQLVDPQGAAFGILQPDMSQMSAADLAKVEAGEGAFNQKKPGHGAWHELTSLDPEAGFAFYSKLLGWSKAATVDMGAMGSYQLFRHRESDIGGMMGLGNWPSSAWLPYFGVDGVSTAIEAIKAGGGSVHHGPHQVPGGGYIAIAQDPQGAWFAVTGANK